MAESLIAINAELEKPYTSTESIVHEPLKVEKDKQNSFVFRIENCTGCHACEAACSEKNQLQPHVSFRNVGYIEGGEYPDFLRLHLSMACNHCSNPVCLDGCPTNSYTKLKEYGAVIHESETCIGCGYCTWVCPYGAPQLNHEKGTVEKCDMCIDRLEAKQKPACVEACLGNALDFGVTDNLYEQYSAYPPLPSASLSEPNFLIKTNIPEGERPASFKRVDFGTVKYVNKTADSGSNGNDLTAQKKAGWGFANLNAKENPLVLFTVLTQLVIGSFILNFFLLDAAGDDTNQDLFLIILCGLQFGAMIVSMLHLGKPQRFYRALANLGKSWISREILFTSAFFGLMTIYTIALFLTESYSPMKESQGINFEYIFPGKLNNFVITLTGWGAVLSGIVSVFAMGRVYMIKSRPYWNHWSTIGSFYSTTFILGPLPLGAYLIIDNMYNGSGADKALPIIAFILTMGVLLKAISSRTLLASLQKGDTVEKLASNLSLNEFGKTRLAGNIASLILLIAGFVIMFIDLPGIIEYPLWIGIFILALTDELLGRAMFYALSTINYIPPGTFYKNSAFEKRMKVFGD